MQRFNLFALGLITLLSAHAAPTADDLAAGFANPPASARPHTWWHWMNGNITKEGITADLEAMKSAGVGGAQIFNVDCGIPEGPVTFLSPQWHELFKHAVREADRLGVELCVHNCAGWSSSGGPWNTPEHAMQMVVSSELKLQGPQAFSGMLPQPPKNADFYRDIAVLAFRTPAGDSAHMKDAHPRLSCSVEKFDGAKLMDGNRSTSVSMPLPEAGHPQYIQVEFPEEYTARTLVIVPGAGMGDCGGEIQASPDGKKFRVLRGFSIPRGISRDAVLQFALGEVKSRWYRVAFTRHGSKAHRVGLAELNFTPALRIDDIDAKGNNLRELNFEIKAASFDASLAVARDTLLDLSAKLQPDGKFAWQVPAGEWTIMRLGYTPTGKNNHPAPAAGTGLECDKLSKEALDAHWAGMMKKLIEDAGPLAGKSLNNALIDSYEVGSQNWNAHFREEFQKRRGYDPVPFLPVLTGRVVGGLEISERFLWDLRRTVSDLFAENYYGHFQTLCHQNGLQASIEPYTGPFESLQCGAPADIPMGEFWTGSSGHGSVKLAASVGHIYGRPVIGAESFTAKPPEFGRWQEDPFDLKALGDSIFCTGVNRFIFHRYAMQPWTNRWPGMTMGQWGFHFDRTSTWWEQGSAWLRYVARCQYLLQQGLFVADACYYQGEKAPNGSTDREHLKPALPAGYDFDAFGPTVLLERMSVKDGRIVLPDGMSYGVLVLSEDKTMSPANLKQLQQLVKAGATVVGPKPGKAPGLSNFPQCDDEVKKLGDELWGGCDGAKITAHAYGRGRIVWGQTMSEVLALLKTQPDFQFAGATKSTDLRYLHRRVADTEVYFVSNQKHSYDHAECAFRVTGKRPELWWPDTGRMEPAPVYREQAGLTTLPLNFEPAGSVFVVFRAAAPPADHLVAVTRSADRGGETAPSLLQIQNAVYEAIDGAGSLNATEILKALVKNDALSVKVDNKLFGKDPANLHHKQLRVVYSIAGKVSQKIVREHGLLDISAESGLPPAFQVECAANGQPEIEAWQPGIYEWHTAAGKSAKAEVAALPPPLEVAGAWELTFPPHWGAPERLTLEKLISWPEHPDQGVRYFSGTATYRKEVDIPANLLGDTQTLYLDLGKVKNLAQVKVNGTDLGILWKPPFRVNVTRALRPGKNQLEIRLTNLWPNRLIGDEQLPEDREWKGLQLKEWPQWLREGKPSPTGRLTFTTWHHWTKDMPLLESGLIGPVRFVSTKKVRLAN